MEALNAVQVALQTIYDMCKAVDRGMTMTGVRLVEKMGGRVGVGWRSVKCQHVIQGAPAAAKIGLVTNFMVCQKFNRIPPTRDF